MTASPEQYDVRTTAAWYVHTVDGVVCSGPHAGEAAARAAGNEFAVRLRASMRRERSDEARIQARVEALRVSYGRREFPHGWFEAVDC